MRDENRRTGRGPARPAFPRAAQQRGAEPAVAPPPGALPPAPTALPPDDALTTSAGAPAVTDPRATLDAVPDGLLRLAAELLAALGPQEVLDLVADRAQDLVGASLVTASVLDPTGDRLHLVVARNAPGAAVRGYESFPLDASTITGDAVLRRRTVLVSSRAERERRYPALAALSLSQEATATFPLVVGDRVLGAISFAFDTAQIFAPEHVDGLGEVARLCALALARATAHEAERAARLEAQRAARRFDALDRTVHRLARATRSQEVVDAVLAAASDSLGATAAVLVEYDAPAAMVRVRASVGLPDALDAARAEFPVRDAGLATDLVTTGQPVLVMSFEDRAVRYPDMADNGVRQAAWANLPFVVDGAVVGWSSFGWDEPRDFSVEDVRYLRILAAHTAAASERVRVLEHARGTAEVLQRALLPEVTRVPGWELATLYLPALTGTEVGGDWFDAFTLPDGRVGLVIGDVAGKGPRAATVMGSVRSALRAYAVRDADPGRVLEHLDTYLGLFKPEEMVTCLFGVLDPATGLLAYANAGHPPGLVVGRAAARTWLDDGLDVPLGVPVPGRRTTVTVRLPCADDGCVVLLYSDGLVERRRGEIRLGLDALACAAGGLAVGDLDLGVRALAAALRHPDGTGDDRALIALRRRRPA